MKLKYKTLLFPLVAAMMMAGCSAERFGGDEVGGAKGKLNLTIGVQVTNAEQVIDDSSSATTPSRAAESRAVTDVSGYIVDLYKAADNTPVKSWTYRDMKGVEMLDPGEYYVSVRSHELQSAGFDCPYFEGRSKNFSIVANELTEIEPVVCTFASLKVSIIFGPQLSRVLGPDVVVTVVANDEGSLDFTPADNRPGYFATVDGSTTLVAEFNGTVNGNREHIIKTYTDVAAGQHRKITFETGGSVPHPGDPTGPINPGEGISINISYEDVALNGSVDPGKEDTLPGDDRPGKLPDVEDPDNPNPGPGPDVPNPPVTSDPITFTGTLENGKTYLNTDFMGGGQAIVNILAPKGVKQLEVTIDSTFLSAGELNEFGLAQNMPLVDGPYEEGLNTLGLPCGDQVRDKTEIPFDITTFMGLLGAGTGSTNTFILKVTDNEDNVAQIQFTINVPAE